MADFGPSFGLLAPILLLPIPPYDFGKKSAILPLPIPPEVADLGDACNKEYLSYLVKHW